MIKRKIMVDIKETVADGKIPVIIGLRRVGKTTILEQLKEEWKCEIVRWDDYENLSLTDDEFFEMINQKAKAGITLLFDEVQERKDWDKMIKTLYDRYVAKKVCNIVVTGSSSMILVGKEMGVDRTRRLYIDTWDFDEYLELTKLKKTIDNFEAFLGRGFPDNALNPEAPLTMLNRTLKPIIENDIPKAFPGTDSLSLLRFLNALSALTNGEVNETTMSKKVGISIPTVRKYVDVLEKAMILKRIYRVDERGIVPRKKQYKVYINPHIHVWLLKKEFKDIDNKAKGHIIESYWLHWAKSINGFFKEFYYLKNSKKEEVDFVSMNPDGSFKTLHEFKYRDKIVFSDIKLISTMESDNKVVWCKETKTEGNIKYISIMDMNKN